MTRVKPHILFQEVIGNSISLNHYTGIQVVFYCLLIGNSKYKLISTNSQNNDSGLGIFCPLHHAANSQTQNV